MFTKTQKKIIILVLSIFGSVAYGQDIDSSIKKIIYKKRNFNAVYQKGHRILLYNGDEEKTREIYKNFKTDFKNIPVKISYSSPDWKVLTKFYASKIEAENILIAIHEKYPYSKILQN